MRKILVSGLIFFFCGVATPVIVKESIKTKKIAYHGDIKGYLTTPGTEGKYPAIILIHEWWGLNEDIRSRARDFSENGYVALAVDLYDDRATKNRRRAQRLAQRVRGNMEAAFENLKAAVSLLKRHPLVDGTRLASIGWCFGGGWSYQIAKNDLGVKTSIIYYGRFNPRDDLQKMRAAILGHFAEKDRGIRIDNVRAFQAKLKSLSGDHEIYIYPDTQHGFANPDNPIYDAEAAKLARKRTLEFLKKYL